MKSTPKKGRRDFLKATPLIAGVALSGTLSACQTNTATALPEDQDILFIPPEDQIQDGKKAAGLLYSQVGYEPGFPVRLLLRMPGRSLLSDEATCELKSTPQHPGQNRSVKVAYWGEKWQNHWWEIEFSELPEGEWWVEIQDKGQLLWRQPGLIVQKGILWDETVEWGTADMLERRFHFTGVGAGWQDAGAKWVESPAQSAMIMSLVDVLSRSKEKLSPELQTRIYEQVKVGANYLVMTEEKATELGNPPGAMCHDVVGHEEYILPNDVAKAVVALYQAAAILPAEEAEKIKLYRETANRSYRWLRETARPLGAAGMNLRQRGLAANASIPADEFNTRDLIFLGWSALERSKLQLPDALEEAKYYARQIMARQIPASAPESGFYGHFQEYGRLPHSQKAWTHCIDGGVFGTDIGAIFPHYLMPLVELLKLHPDDSAAGDWKECLETFAKGYLIPACQANPFHLAPLGVFGEEGLIWFAGPFHGTNAIYGYTAALALELHQLFDDPFLRTLAMGNLQWLAGLNAGITRENLKACVIFTAEVPEGVALPASMIHRVGRRTAGTWFNTKGVICNGFSTGTQFKMDVDPTAANDGPFSFTDEDWIPHTAGWLTALTRWYT